MARNVEITVYVLDMDGQVLKVRHPQRASLHRCQMVNPTMVTMVIRITPPFTARLQVLWRCLRKPV